MDCLQYTDASDIFSELVNDINADCQVSSKVPQALKTEEHEISRITNEDSDAWVEVFVPVASLQKHIKTNNDGITEDEVIREANREKVLEMYGTSKIEAIPLSNGAGKTDVQEVTVESHQVAEFTSGRLFAPPSNKRALRHPNPPFRCPECLAGFTRADNLKRHFKILHEGSESFACPHCYRAFARKNTLQRHITSQHTKEKKYKCDYCEKKFTYSFEVPVHYQNAHSDMKGYQCRLCEMKFKWPRSLDRHVLSVHEGFKFKCTECGILLGCLDAYKKHGARFHPTNPALSMSVVVKDSYPPINRDFLPPTSGETYTCPHCGCIFAVKSNLDRHIMKIHSKGHVGLMMQCEWCSNKFRSRDTYHRHVKKFHSSQVVDDIDPDTLKSTSASGNFGVVESDMTEISLTEFLSHYNTDQLNEELPFS